MKMFYSCFLFSAFLREISNNQISFETSTFIDFGSLNENLLKCISQVSESLLHVKALA